jgi:hypothetical protein
MNELENSLVKIFDDDHLNLLTSDKIFDQLKSMNDAINELKSIKHEVIYFYLSLVILLFLSFQIGNS